MPNVWGESTDAGNITVDGVSNYTGDVCLGGDSTCVGDTYIQAEGNKRIKVTSTETEVTGNLLTTGIIYTSSIENVSGTLDLGSNSTDFVNIGTEADTISLGNLANTINVNGLLEAKNGAYVTGDLATTNDLLFEGVTGGDIVIPDNQATSLEIKDAGGDSYMTIDTTTGGKKVQVAQTLDVNGKLTVANGSGGCCQLVLDAPVFANSWTWDSTAVSTKLKFSIDDRLVYSLPKGTPVLPLGPLGFRTTETFDVGDTVEISFLYLTSSINHYFGVVDSSWGAAENNITSATYYLASYSSSFSPPNIFFQFHETGQAAVAASNPDLVGRYACNKVVYDAGTLLFYDDDVLIDSHTAQNLPVSGSLRFFHSTATNGFFEATLLATSASISSNQSGIDIASSSRGIMSLTSSGINTYVPVQISESLTFNKPVGELYWNNNTEATDITAASTVYEVATSTGVGTCDFKNMFACQETLIAGTAYGQELKYTGEPTKLFHCGCSFSVIGGANSGLTYAFFLMKNGVEVSSSRVTMKLDSNNQNFSTALHGFVELATNDLLSIGVTQTSGSPGDITVDNANIFAVAFPNSTYT